MNMSRSAKEMPALVDSSVLRILTVFFFYFCQGVPLGLFFYAVPAWMAAGGAGAVQVASVVGMAALPWSLKLVNGFIMDRYTYLPMGRRRIWIVGAQSTIILVLVAGALAAPLPTDILLLTVLAFCASSATTFQDVAIDGLVVDIMTGPEQAKAGGVMFGAQVLGMSASTAVNGWVAEYYGISASFILSAAVLAIVMTYVIVLRERHGERRFPWSQGASHPRNLEIQIDAWWPLLKQAFKAVMSPISLLFIPFIIIRSTPAGGGEAFHPILVTEILGWSPSDYTNLMSTVGLVAAMLGLVFGGWIVSRLGSQKTLCIVLPIQALILGGMALAKPIWAEPGVFPVYVYTLDIVSIFFSIATIPLAMRLCSPAVAATQFTIYMAMGNFGRPLGAWIAGLTTGGDTPQTMYWIFAGLFGVAAVSMPFLRLPAENKAVEEELAHGAGAAPIEN